MVWIVFIFTLKWLELEENVHELLLLLLQKKGRITYREMFVLRKITTNSAHFLFSVLCTMYIYTIPWACTSIHRTLTGLKTWNYFDAACTVHEYCFYLKINAHNHILVWLRTLYMLSVLSHQSALILESSCWWAVYMCAYSVSLLSTMFSFSPLIYINAFGADNAGALTLDIIHFQLNNQIK